VQAELAFSPSQPCPRTATVGLLGLDSGAYISGLVVDLGQGWPLLVFKWTRKLRHEPGTPPALAAYGDVEPAEVFIDAERVGHATIMDILKAALIGCDDRATIRVPWFLRELRSALAAQRRQSEEPACRQALAAALAGPALRLMDRLAKQCLLDELWWRPVDWRQAVCAFDSLAKAGMGDFAAFALRPDSRPPRATLARRIARIGDPQVVSDFVRVALSIPDPRERDLFEQAILRTLQAVGKAWRGAGEPRARQALVAACRLAVSLADRTAFCVMRWPTHPQFDADAVMSQFALKWPVHAVTRGLVESQCPGAVRIAVLYEWVRRVERELRRRAWPDPQIGTLQAESNEVLEAAVLGIWNCRALQEHDWDELAQADWPAAEPIDLPELTWGCELPAAGVALLSKAGITVEALRSTARLRAEANEMQNCLASSLHYLTELQLGRSRIYALKGALRVTLELRLEGADQWNLNQVRGLGNVLHEIDFIESADERWEAVRGFVAAVCTPTVGVARLGSS
jgi:hypothetical protein